MSIHTLWGWKSSSERPMHAFSLNPFLHNVNVLYFHNSIALRKKKKNPSFLSEGLLKAQIYLLTTKAMALDIFDPHSLHTTGLHKTTLHITFQLSKVAPCFHIKISICACSSENGKIYTFISDGSYEATDPQTGSLLWKLHSLANNNSISCFSANTMDRVDYSIFREAKIAFRENIYSAIFIFSHRIIKLIV